MFTAYPYKSGLVKAWDKGVEFDYVTQEQLRKIAALPFIHKHVAAMPDAHLGKGATVGSVIATKGAIVPAAVGVDIGCGMCAWQTTLFAKDLPDSLRQLRLGIEEMVPVGEGKWDDTPGTHYRRYRQAIMDDYETIVQKHPGALSKNTHNQIGTMGGGNHFIELCLDENQQVWVMLHSGSRGMGNRIGSYFISKAKEEMEKYHIHLPEGDKDLAYLVEHTELYDDYVFALGVAQKFAWESRVLMMETVIEVMEDHLPPFKITSMAVNCHHNYVEIEHHYGANVLVTRKGAVRAREGDLGIIPGSMGTRSYIVRGLGNAESFCSCSHGAGRRMSRGQAKREITLEAHEAALAGIECRKDIGVLDESPAAYKDIDAVIAAQSDLIEVVHTLKQVLNVKG